MEYTFMDTNSWVFEAVYGTQNKKTGIKEFELKIDLMGKMHATVLAIYILGVDR